MGVYFADTYRISRTLPRPEGYLYQSPYRTREGDSKDTKKPPAKASDAKCSKLMHVVLYGGAFATPVLIVLSVWLLGFALGVCGVVVWCGGGGALELWVSGGVGLWSCWFLVLLV